MREQPNFSGRSSARSIYGTGVIGRAMHLSRKNEDALRSASWRAELALSRTSSKGRRPRPHLNISTSIPIQRQPASHSRRRSGCRMPIEEAGFRFDQSTCLGFGDALDRVHCCNRGTESHCASNQWSEPLNQSVLILINLIGRACISACAHT